ncbi:MAG: MATE family efflux transporter [Treponema sp.]|nr:MATE family efflux transporter [Treponema sp.]
MYAIPGIALYNAAAALFRSNGNSRISMNIAVLVNLLNIGGNDLLIYGFNFYVEGVAWPTFISRTLAAIVLLLLLYYEKGNRGEEKEKSYFISIKGISKTRPDSKFIGKILKIGVPNMLENSSFQFGKVLVLNVVTLFGTGAIAANAAGNTLAGVEVIPGSALGMCMLTVIGQCLGAGRKDQAIYYTKKLMIWAYLGFAAINIPFLLSSHWILSFLGLGEDTINAAWLIVLTHGILGMLFWCMSFCLPNALRAAGDATYTMIVSTASMWIIRVGLSFVFQKTRLLGLMDYFNLPECYGALCVWFSMICDWLVRIMFFGARIFSGKWLNKKVI